MSHIGNTFTYGAAGIATALSLIGLGKVGQFLKSNGSIVSAGLLTGVATAAAVPLTKRAVVFLPPEIYENPRLQLISLFKLPGERKDQVDFVLSCIASLGLSLVVTALLTNRLTNFISGYRLSYPKLAGVSLLSGAISGVGFGAGSLFVKQQIRENRSEQNSILAQKVYHDARSFIPEVMKTLSTKGQEINEANIATVLENELTPEQFAQALSHFYQTRNWTHQLESSKITLSPFMILAHVQDPNTRYLIYQQCKLVNGAIKETLGDEATLEEYPAANRLDALNEQLRIKVDAETLAMCISFNPRHQEALLNAIESSRAFRTFQVITRQDVEAHLPPPVTRNYPRGLLDQLNGSIHQEAAFGQLAQHLHRIGITDPKAYAKVLEQLGDDHVIAHLNYMYQQRDFECFPGEEHSVTLSPYFVLAHFKDPQQRDRIFMRTQMYEMAKGTIEPPYTSLSEYSAQSRIEEVKPSLGHFIDASVFAMLFAPIEDQELQQALLGVFEGEQKHLDLNMQPITRAAIEAAMGKSSASQLEIPSFTTDEGITAAIAGLGTLALTSAILTTMILTSRLAVWTWASYPTIRGVFPTATLVAAGYMVGKTATNNSKIGYFAAFVLGTFGSPKANRLISSHEMSYWHGAGFSIAGILGYSLMNQEPARRR